MPPEPDDVTPRALSLLPTQIFVNYGGGGYVFFSHSAWNGLTVADLVFPIFVWTQGVSLAISFSSMRRRGTTVRALLAKVSRPLCAWTGRRVSRRAVGRELGYE